MIWSIEFLEEAEKDMKKLDHSAQIQVLKGIRKVSQNPLSVREGGYGKPLGNKSGALEAKSDNVPPLFRRYVFVGKEVRL